MSALERLIETNSLEEFKSTYLPDSIPLARDCEPEEDDGNTEYKWRLLMTSVTSERLDGLTTQMRFRLNEGRGRAFYRLGVKDNGQAVGIPACEMFETVTVLYRIASRLNAQVVLEGFYQARGSNFHSQVEEKLAAANLSSKTSLSISMFYTAYFSLIIEVTPPSPPAEVLGRVYFFGPSGCGKTTLIGALISDRRDDGKGALRTSTTRILHEILNGGVTASVHSYLLQRGDAFVELMDLPGSLKYRKTFFRGVTSNPGDLIVLLGDSDIYDKLADLLEIPVIRVSPKSDLEISSHSLAVSAVSLQGVDELRNIIFSKICKKIPADIPQTDASQPPLFSAEESWLIKGESIVGGVLEKGTLRIGTHLNVLKKYRKKRDSEGRLSDGSPPSTPSDAIVIVKSIRNARGETLETFSHSGGSCSIGVEFLDERNFNSRPFRVPCLLSGGLGGVELVDNVTLTVSSMTSNCYELNESFCRDSNLSGMLYWRSFRQEVKVERVENKTVELSLTRGPTFIGAINTALLVLNNGTMLKGCVRATQILLSY